MYYSDDECSYQRRASKEINGTYLAALVYIAFARKQNGHQVYPTVDEARQYKNHHDLYKILHQRPSGKLLVRWSWLIWSKVI